VCTCGDNEICSFKDGEEQCNCKPGHEKDGEKCKVCTCGDNAICSFKDGEEQCKCKPGHEKDGEECKVCTCSDNEICSFKDGEDQCKCKPGHEKDGEKCKVCTCGVNEICSFKDGEKQCICKPEHEKDGDECKVCTCGVNEICSFKGGEKQCICKPEHEKDGDECKVCTCGVNEICSFKDGEKQCICKPEHEKDGDECKELTSTVAPTTTSTISSSTDTTEHSKETAETTFDQSSTSDEKSSSETITPVSPTRISSTVTSKVTEDGGKDVCAEKQPCENGGTCELDDEGGYTCKCRPGFSGRNCETAQWCLDNKDICGNTACKYDENVGSAFCSCNANLYFDAKRKTCVELDKCSLARIKGNCSGDHETCDEMGICKCEENYAYNDDQSVCEPDFCLKKSRKPRCMTNMECFEEEQSYSCFCKKDFWQIDSKCVKVDKCALGVSKCEHKCFNGICSCFQGFSLNENNYSCDLADTDTECDLNCGKGICVKKGSIEKCICPEISHVLENNTCVDRCKAGKLKKDECPKEMGCLSDEDLGYNCNCTGKYEYAEDGVHCKPSACAVMEVAMWTVC
ncbi:unnamed protein product, partial [Larinioides sclopetarius]